MDGDPFEMDVSVSAAKAHRRSLRSGSGARGAGFRKCEHPGCRKHACHRAPKSRDRIEEFHWFCLDHVRAYNAKWNYFSDLDPEEIEAVSRASGLWDRPTRHFGPDGSREPFHAHRNGDAWRRMGFENLRAFLGRNATINPAASSHADNGAHGGAFRPRLSRAEQHALEILGVDERASMVQARGRFRVLVKTFHPDLNGGGKEDATRLREVLRAWEIIKASKRFGR